MWKLKVASCTNSLPFLYCMDHSSLSAQSLASLSGTYSSPSSPFISLWAALSSINNGHGSKSTIDSSKTDSPNKMPSSPSKSSSSSSSPFLHPSLSSPLESSTFSPTSSFSPCLLAKCTTLKCSSKITSSSKCSTLSSADPEPPSSTSLFTLWP